MLVALPNSEFRIFAITKVGRNVRCGISKMVTEEKLPEGTEEKSSEATSVSTNTEKKSEEDKKTHKAKKSKKKDGAPTVNTGLYPN